MNTTVELKNKVSLGETMRYMEAGYELSKEEARTVFFGRVEEIVCHCCIPGCSDGRGGKPHQEEYVVEYMDSGGIYIGCVHFNPEEVAVVKNWLGE